MKNIKDSNAGQLTLQETRALRDELVENGDGASDTYLAPMDRMVDQVEDQPFR